MCVLWVCDALASHRELSGTSSMATEGNITRQGQMKDEGQCCRIRAGRMREGQDAEGEQEIARPGETDRQGK